MGFPKATERALTWLAALTAERDGVTLKRMFGNQAAFANGYMHAGVLGDGIMLRLSPADREALLAVAGTSIPEPLPGKPMREYVLLPSAWRDRPAETAPWVDRSLAFVGGMPPKKPKQRKPKQRG